MSSALAAFPKAADLVEQVGVGEPRGAFVGVLNDRR